MIPWWVLALVVLWVLLIVGYTCLLWANAAHRTKPRRY